MRFEEYPEKEVVPGDHLLSDYEDEPPVVGVGEFEANRQRIADQAFAKKNQASCD